LKKNNKCIASKFNNCEGPISGEHYISRAILEFLSNNNTAEIYGLPWIEPKKIKKIGINSLTSNILCSKHNSDLSDYDSEILKLFKAFDEIDKHFNGSINLNINEVIIDGDKIEKWMLKACVGMIASKQISNNHQRQEIINKDIYLDILFDNKIFPNNWGLYFKIPENKTIHKFNGYSFLPKTANNELKSVEFWINNFIFNFVLGEPDNQEEWGIYRINKIIFKNGNESKIIKFNWDDKKYNKYIELSRIKTSDKIPENWEKYLS